MTTGPDLDAVLERTADGWWIRRRVNRLVDGNAEACDLLGGAVPLCRRWRGC